MGRYGLSAHTYFCAWRTEITVMTFFFFIAGQQLQLKRYGKRLVFGNGSGRLRMQHNTTVKISIRRTTFQLATGKPVFYADNIPGERLFVIQVAKSTVKFFEMAVIIF